jgi:hypothetical protein
MVSDTLNQAGYQTNQNLEIDIDKIYSDFIQEIDNVRSIVNTSLKQNEVLLKNLNNKSLLKLSSSLQFEKTPQESRCHAFFRLIGFPVLSKDDKMYNPGFDNVQVGTINLSDKLEIANDPIPGFYEMSVKRETYTNKIAAIFSFTKTIDAAVLALSSSTNIRSFSAPLEDSDDPLFLQNKPYTIDFNGKVASKIIALNLFEDGEGNTAQLVSKNKYHYIRPFIVDPRIDFSVSPAKNKISVPFVNDKFELKINETDYAKRPLIEKIIRDRFNIDPYTTTLGDATLALFEDIKTSYLIKNENIINKVFSGSINLSEQEQFANFLNIIYAMCIKLIDAQLFISDAQDRYYWLPIPNKDGPELGSSYYPVIVNLPDYLTTQKDNSIITAQIKNTINKLSALNITTTNADNDIGGFAFDSFKTTFSSNNSEALGDVSAETLKTLLAERDSYLKDAGNALKTIEIIMGEFSGLGLCDIIAILGALYIIPKEDLLGFLDDDAYARMKQSIKVPDEINRSSIRTSLNSLTTSVKDYYTLMDKIYQDLSMKNK